MGVITLKSKTLKEGTHYAFDGDGGEVQVSFEEKKFQVHMGGKLLFAETRFHKIQKQFNKVRKLYRLTYSYEYVYLP